jgi:hypothetical protein
MLWSPVRIEGKPSILIVDASYNLEGWERAFCARLYGIMSRRGLALAGDGPIVVRDPEDFLSQTGSNISYNSVLLVGYGLGSRALGPDLFSYWVSLSSTQDRAPKLFAACYLGSQDHTEANGTILKSPNTVFPIALSSQLPLSARASGLFFIKFFTELELHSDGQVTGKMAWFSCAKANELLRKRKLEGKVLVKC